MKDFLSVILALCIIAGFSACTPALPEATTKAPPSVETLSLGQTFVADGVSFTLQEFCFAEKTDYDTYNPNMIDGASWSPNSGYIFGYMKYKIVNNGKNTLDHHMNVNVYMEYGEGYKYGTSLMDYTVACEDEDKYNLDVDPLMSKTFHRIISNCPSSIAPPTKDIKIIVSINGKTCAYLIPANKVTINKGQDAPKPEIPFTVANSSTASQVKKVLDGAKYEWYNGTIKCTLTFSGNTVKLTQRISGQDFVASGTYVVGTDKLKANYGKGDVYYGWSYDKNGDIELTIIDN